MGAKFESSDIIGNDLDGLNMPNIPVVGESYIETLNRLVFFKEDGITHFYGGPLDMGSDNARVWLSPAEVNDGDSRSYFQIIYVNCMPDQALDDKTIPVTLLDIDEASFKLTPEEHPGFLQLMDQLRSDRPQILIRHCNEGIAYYPRVTVPGKNQKDTHANLEKLIGLTGWQEPETSVTLRKPSEDTIIGTDASSLENSHSRMYTFMGRSIFSYGLILEDDPWKYYEIFSPKKIEEVNDRDLLVRIDSGCDIGQIYNDRGCDCREQLHSALHDMQVQGSGIVIHIPGQDGRGFGAAVKMETEGIKQGIKVITNKDLAKPTDTVTAARSLLGENFDIRTYDGAGRLLKMLGVESIVLQTDNRQKLSSIAESGIRVSRKATLTTGANGSLHHVRAKHNHSALYFNPDE